MSFFFKSKKNQDRGLHSRDGPASSQSSIQGGGGGGGGSGSTGGRALARDEKGNVIQRSTPTGSLNSFDNDGSVGSPDHYASRQRGQSLDQQPQSPRQPPPLSEKSPLQPQSQPSSDLPFRNPPPVAPNASLYPWSQRRFLYTTSHPHPFPRYGAAVNAVASKEGDVYVMGGLINSATVKGDLWLIEAGGNMACYPLATSAEGPGPRVGHASLLVGNAFIVYGGDTKIDQADVLDETLYLLNTSTRQWSRALPAGPRPSGRYGHSLNILGSKIYIFGGQVEGYFMNDLSAFDLNMLQMPNNRWELLIPNTETGLSPQGAKVPPARTNHSVVTYNDKMYLFGGTNGVQWFNDVWCYDPVANAWSQLDCIGYIPIPREGHAAALVDDVMYIFGGRTEEGADLGDLAAFRITSRRWYTFQNMGPSPSPRSGHSMTTVGKSIVVVGGEPSSAAAAVTDLGLVYVLDTTKIRYPGDSQSGSSSSAGQRLARGLGAAQQQRPQMLPSSESAPNVTRNLASRDGSAGPPEARRMVSAPRDASGADMVSALRGLNASDLNGGVTGAIAGSKLPRAAGTPPGPAGPPPQGQPPKPALNTAVSRVRNASLDRGDAPSSSPTLTAQSQSPVSSQAAFSKDNGSPSTTTNGRRTPTQPPVSSSRTKPPTEAAAAAAADVAPKPRSARQPRSQEPPPPPESAANSTSNSTSTTNTTSQRSTTQQRPSSPPPPTRQASNPLSRRSSGRNSQTVALLKELDAARNRNAWYASELELAKKAGYVPTTSLGPLLDGGPAAAETFDEDDRPLIEALLAMRTELANVQASVDKQAVLAARQIAEAERQRDAAIQEAVYAKAKLAAAQQQQQQQQTGSSSPSGTRQLGRSGSSNDGREESGDGGDRTADVGRKLAAALHRQRELQGQVERMGAELDGERRARQLADDTVQAAQKRLADLEAYKQRTSLEVEQLRAELHAAQREARDAAVRAAEAAAAAQRLALEREELQGRCDAAAGGAREHGEALSALREAAAAAAETKALLERRLDEERTAREKAEAKLAQLRAEHEARTAELVAATQRLRDAEELAEHHANESRRHQQAVLAGLDRAAAAQDQDRAAGRDGSGGADSERVAAALQEQVEAAHALARKYQQEADAAADRLRSAEERIAGLEAYQEQASREGVTIRRQLQAALRETQSLQAANAELQHRLSSQQLETNAITVQHNTLKELLSERGISPTNAGRAATASRSSPRGSPREDSSSEQQRLRELEQQLAGAVAAHEETKAAAAAQAQEAEAAYRDKLAQLENDYQSAVHYVKGTEKMLKQLKEQLSRYKTENGRLKEQVVELEDKVEEAGGGGAGSASSAKGGGAAAAGDAPSSDGWEAERESLQARVELLQAELQATSLRMEGELRAVRQELEAERQGREEAARQLQGSRADLEQLQRENALLERRAQDAEQRVTLLLDQVGTSVGTYRRRSRLVASGATTGSDTNGDAALLHQQHPQQQQQQHARQDSNSDVGSQYAGGLDARNSTALDHLADELETLRSHWEATNKNYRLSTTFDLDAPATPTTGMGPRRDERENLGLSESLADWRKRLDDDDDDDALLAEGKRGTAK